MGFIGSWVSDDGAVFKFEALKVASKGIRGSVCVRVKGSGHVANS